MLVWPMCDVLIDDLATGTEKPQKTTAEPPRSKFIHLEPVPRKQLRRRAKSRQIKIRRLG